MTKKRYMTKDELGKFARDGKATDRMKEEAERIGSRTVFDDLEHVPYDPSKSGKVVVTMTPLPDLVWKKINRDREQHIPDEAYPLKVEPLEDEPRGCGGIMLAVGITGMLLFGLGVGYLAGVAGWTL